MWQALKAKDLQRDPRFALHSATFDPDNDWPGEAKIAGIAHEIVDEDEVKELNGEAGRTAPATRSGSTSPRCRRSASTTSKTHLLIDIWTPERGVRTIKRDVISRRSRAER